MDEAVPSLSSHPGSVGSRFVSQNDIDSANSRRDEQWKAAYARLGQEPPPRPQEDVFDGRSLAEKLAANKIAKQEEWEEKTKLANQFRALEEDEVQFLDLIRSEQERKEKERNAEDAEEVKGFKEAIASRNTLGDKPDFFPPALSSSSPSLSAQAQTKEKSKVKVAATSSTPAKKVGGVKGGLKGVVLKKKSSTASKPGEKGKVSSSERAGKTNETEKRKVVEAENEAGMGSKKQKTS